MNTAGYGMLICLVFFAVNLTLGRSLLVLKDRTDGNFFCMTLWWAGFLLLVAFWLYVAVRLWQQRRFWWEFVQFCAREWRTAAGIPSGGGSNRVVAHVKVLRSGRIRR